MVFSIIRNTKMINKIIVWLAFLALVVGVLGLWYIDYITTKPCVELKSLQSDKERSIKFKNELMNYIRLDQTRLELTKKAGGVFDIFEFSTPLKPFISDKELSKKIQYILIKNDLPDYEYIEPYKVLEVGAGYGRTYITFQNNETANSRVFCTNDKDQENGFYESFISKKKIKENKQIK